MHIDTYTYTYIHTHIYEEWPLPTMAYIPFGGTCMDRILLSLVPASPQWTPKDICGVTRTETRTGMDALRPWGDISTAPKRGRNGCPFFFPKEPEMTAVPQARSPAAVKM